MYHHKPVVTHVAVPSHPGMGVFQAQMTLVDHGRTGFACSYDVNEYFVDLMNLASNWSMRSEMGRAGYNKAKTEFDWRVSGAKLVSIYESFLCNAV
jgi:glycosyltransferase involved in cell wall biosynthesis